MCPKSRERRGTSRRPTTRGHAAPPGRFHAAAPLLWNRKDPIKIGSASPEKDVPSSSGALSCSATHTARTLHRVAGHHEAAHHGVFATQLSSRGGGACSTADLVDGDASWRRRGGPILLLTSAARHAAEMAVADSYRRLSSRTCNQRGWASVVHQD